jgi:hypothetical protein
LLGLLHLIGIHPVGAAIRLGRAQIVILDSIAGVQLLRRARLAEYGVQLLVEERARAQRARCAAAAARDERALIAER